MTLLRYEVKASWLHSNGWLIYYTLQTPCRLQILVLCTHQLHHTLPLPWALGSVYQVNEWSHDVPISVHVCSQPDAQLQICFSGFCYMNYVVLLWCPDILTWCSKTKSSHSECHQKWGQTIRPGCWANLHTYCRVIRLRSHNSLATLFDYGDQLG